MVSPGSQFSRVCEFGFVLYPSVVANAAKGPSGLLGWPSGTSQYKPLCFPPSLMNFRANCPLLSLS